MKGCIRLPSFLLPVFPPPEQPCQWEMMSTAPAALARCITTVPSEDGEISSMLNSTNQKEGNGDVTALAAIS